MAFFPLVLLSLVTAAQFASASAVPTSKPVTSISTSDTPISSSSSPSAFSIPKKHGPGPVMPPQQQRPKNYIFDPFSVLGGNGSGNEGVGDAQPKPAATSRVETSSAVAIMSLSISTASDAQAKTTSSAASSASGGTGTTPSTTTATSADIPSAALQTSTHVDDSTTSSRPTSSSDSNANISVNTNSSGSSMNSWKIIGIGVLAFAGIVVLMIGFVFHDSLWRTIRRVRGKDEELLVPDWKRGSWRFGGESFDGAEKDEGGPRIGDGEKGEPCFPLPPLSPFPLRRIPSANANCAANLVANRSAGTIGNGGEHIKITHVQSNGYSIIPSPPPATYTPQPVRSNLSVVRRPTVNTRAPPKTEVNVRSEGPAKASSGVEQSEEDAYGGIEEQ